MGSDLARAWAEAAGASGSPVVVMGGRAGWRPVGQTCQGDPGGTSRRARGAQFTGRPLRSGVGVGLVSRHSCCHSRGMVPAEAWGQAWRNPGEGGAPRSRAPCDRSEAG